MTRHMPVFHVLLATSLELPWEGDVPAASIRAAYDQALGASGVDESTVTHLLVRQLTDDHAG